jgi:hypothetical protein
MEIKGILELIKSEEREVAHLEEEIKNLQEFRRRKIISNDSITEMVIHLIGRITESEKRLAILKKTAQEITEYNEDVESLRERQEVER